MRHGNYYEEKVPDYRMVIDINIQEQCELLRSQLKIELLTSDEANKEIIKNFRSNKKGKSLERYLKEDAWREDQQGITKVYLVKDSDNIVFFFALGAGLLYKEINSDDINLSTVEKEILDLCVDARLQENNDITPDVVFSWYADADDIDKEKLHRIIDERIQFKLDAKEDLEKSGNSINIKQVSETFPGIVLTHFCKNASYSFPEHLSFPVGFYVFWEIVVEKVLYIASILGCQYLYLFAADNSEQEYIQVSNLYPGDWEIDDEEDSQPVYKLVEYYKNELKFEDVQDVTILKPYYDFSCISLLQEISALSENRNAAWIQHSDVNN